MNSQSLFQKYLKQQDITIGISANVNPADYAPPKLGLNNQKRICIPATSTLFTDTFHYQKTAQRSYCPSSETRSETSQILSSSKYASSITLISEQYSSSEESYKVVVKYANGIRVFQCPASHW
jgi:hypothetical protein